MIQLNEATGEIVIDFAIGPVTIRPPKYGAYKRLRAERQRLADELTDAVAALPSLPDAPDEDDQSDEAKAVRLRLGPIYQARLREVEEMTVETLAKTWRFILIGDDTFAGLADPVPPDDPDEWPTGILIDAGEMETRVVTDPKTGKETRVRVRTNATVLDQVFLHLSRARYRSGSTAP